MLNEDPFLRRRRLPSPYMLVTFGMKIHAPGVGGISLSQGRGGGFLWDSYNTSLKQSQIC